MSHFIYRPQKRQKFHFEVYKNDLEYCIKIIVFHMSYN